MSASALYSWLNTNLITLARADAINIKSSSVESAIDFMGRVDPIEMPEGVVQLGELRIQWKVGESITQADVIDDQNKITINQASLWPADIFVYRGDKLLHEFPMVLLGIKKVREASDVIFD
jgi:general secretion pathway protein I